MLSAKPGRIVSAPTTGLKDPLTLYLHSGVHQLMGEQHVIANELHGCEQWLPHLAFQWGVGPMTTLMLIAMLIAILLWLQTWLQDGMAVMWLHSMLLLPSGNMKMHCQQLCAKGSQTSSMGKRMMICSQCCCTTVGDPTNTLRFTDHWHDVNWIQHKLLMYHACNIAFRVVALLTTTQFGARVVLLGFLHSSVELFCMHLSGHALTGWGTAITTVATAAVSRLGLIVGRARVDNSSRQLD